MSATLSLKEPTSDLLSNNCLLYNVGLFALQKAFLMCKQTNRDVSHTDFNDAECPWFPTAIDELDI